MDQAVERHELGECRAGHFTDGRGDGAFHRAGGLDGVEQVVHGLSELGGRYPAVDGGRVDLRGLLASERVGERTAEHDHVVEHVVNGELVARRRVVELCGFDAVDHRAEGRQDVGELFCGFHELPFDGSLSAERFGEPGDIEEA